MWFLPSGRRLLTLFRPTGGDEQLFVADPAAADPAPFLLLEASGIGGLPSWWYSWLDPPASLDDRLLLWDVAAGVLLHADLSGDAPYTLEPVLDSSVALPGPDAVSWAPP